MSRIKCQVSSDKAQGPCCHPRAGGLRDRFTLVECTRVREDGYLYLFHEEIKGRHGEEDTWDPSAPGPSWPFPKPLACLPQVGAPE